MTDRASERIYFQDPPVITLLRESRPRAAKPHVCSVCCAPIEAGERHILYVYIDHDSLGDPLRQSRTHHLCPPPTED